MALRQGVQSLSKDTVILDTARFQNIVLSRIPGAGVQNLISAF